jgi:hypothetical protein
MDVGGQFNFILDPKVTEMKFDSFLDYIDGSVQ